MTSRRRRWSSPSSVRPRRADGLLGDRDVRLNSSRSVAPVVDEAARVEQRDLAVGVLASGTPASTSARCSRRAMPTPAAPAPGQHEAQVAELAPEDARGRARMPARATAAVPWMSSLKLGTRSRKWSRMRSALGPLKSSHWMMQPGHVSATPSHEGLDELVVGRPAQAPRAIADVERVVRAAGGCPCRRRARRAASARDAGRSCAE